MTTETDLASLNTHLAAAKAAISPLNHKALAAIALAQTDATNLANDINPPPPPLVLAPIANQTATVGTAISPIDVTWMGGAAPVSVTASGLPAGLALSAGVISGTPTAAGQTAVSVSVTDSSSPAQIAAWSFTITVAAVTPPTGTLLGVYNGNGPGVTNGMPVGAQQFITETGAPIKVARYYLDGSDTWATSTNYLAQSFEGTTAVRMNLCIPTPTQTGNAAGGASQFWAQAASGAYNSAWQTMLEYFVSLGFGDAILSPWWEWDGTQNPSVPADATDYTNSAKAYNEFATVARSVSADFHLSWYCGGYNYSYASWWANCVPEASLVDSVSIDFYDQNWGGWGTVGSPSAPGLTQAQHNYAWSNYQLPLLTWFAKQATAIGKPMGFGEWGIWQPTGSNYGGDDPYWMNDFITWMKAHNVYWAAYFNSGPNVLSAAPNSLAAFKTAFG